MLRQASGMSMNRFPPLPPHCSLLRLPTPNSSSRSDRNRALLAWLWAVQVGPQNDVQGHIEEVIVKPFGLAQYRPPSLDLSDRKQPDFDGYQWQPALECGSVPIVEILR